MADDNTETESCLYRCFVVNKKYVILALIVFILIAAGVIYIAVGGKIRDTQINGDNQINNHDDVIPPAPPKWADNEEIRIFREYLRIPTVHPNVNYKPAVAFLEKQAASLNLPVKIYHPVDDKNPVVVMTWEGSQPELPTILLNSHMDVVSVYEEYWTHPPFAAEMNDNGDIIARGTQDMKCVGMWYLAAIRALKRLGVDRLKRTVNLIYVPDEEEGGLRGMDGFTKSEAFKAMNVAFALDEGGTSRDDGTLTANYFEKTIWDFDLIFHGISGHGSSLFDNTSGEKLNYVVAKMYELREIEKKKANELNYPRENTTSINLTMLKGGVQSNVIPAEMTATFDIRLSINTELEQLEQQIMQWCEEVGGEVSIRDLERGEKQKATRVDDSNPFWVAFKNAVNQAIYRHISGLKVEPAISTASSDMKYIRRFDISAIGFSPMINTTGKAHQHDEYLNADVYLAGIETYKTIIMSLGNV